MVNAFEILGVTPRVWYSEGFLEKKLRELCETTHPDQKKFNGDEEKGGGFMEAQQAFRIVSVTSSRLKLLLELEGRAVKGGGQAVPSDLADTFMEMGAFVQGVDAFFKKYDEVASVIEKAVMKGEQMKWVEQVQVMQGEIFQKRRVLNEALEAFDGKWDTGAKNLDDLSKLYHRECFISRWENQLEPRLFKLMSEI